MTLNEYVNSQEGFVALVFTPSWDEGQHLALGLEDSLDECLSLEGEIDDEGRWCWDLSTTDDRPKLGRESIREITAYRDPVRWSRLKAEWLNADV